LSGVTIKKLIQKTRKTGHSSKVLKAESERNIIKRSDGLQTHSSKAVVWGLWLLCGSDQAGGRNLGVSAGGVRMIGRLD
jgi:hypothetical protein